jgi:hypothetical protein
MSGGVELADIAARLAAQNGTRPLPPPPSPAGFIARYVSVAQRRTDAPVEAHQLAAVAVLSALAGPRPRLPLAHRSGGTRLVLWTMNVVDSTSGRKTTVNELALEVIRHALGEAAVLPWKGSPEAFIQAFAKLDRQAAVFARDEYSGLLAQIKRGGYVAGLAQDFIRAYDGLPITMARTSKVKAKSGERIEDTDRVAEPYLVKLCAATRTSFIETAGIEDVLDGLLARFVFTAGVSAERRMARSTDELDAAWRGVLDHGQAFHERAQELLTIDLPEAVLEAEWILEQELRAQAANHPRADAARPAMKRLAETVLKVGALLAIDRDQADVTLADFRDAEALARPWVTTTLALIEDLGRTRFQARADAVLASVNRHPDGISRRDLFRAHRSLTGREFDEVLTALEQQGLVHAAKSEPTVGRPAILYRPGPAPEPAT